MWVMHTPEVSALLNLILQAFGQQTLTHKPHVTCKLDCPVVGYTEEGYCNKARLHTEYTCIISLIMK
jgi:hypothetical protein